jgi:class 3 adenylate cyclase
MRLRGDFSEAEEEARRALTELTAFGRLPQAGAGSNEIGEVRLRLGDLDGAEEAFRTAHRLGHEPHPGLALVHLARGQTEAARASIATALADAVDPIDRARLLAAKAEIALAAHDVTDARSAADELAGLASSLDSPVLHAMSHQTSGATLTYEEEPTAAITELRKALRAWTEVDAPFEAAQTRRSLALAHRLSGDEASAVLELRAAKESFARLGAQREVGRCDELLRAGDEDAAGRRVTRTFMFTDIVGSTDLIGTIGDEAWKDVVHWHDETLRTVIGSHRGEVVRMTGERSTGAVTGSRRRSGSASTRPRQRRSATTMRASVCTKPRGSVHSPREARSSQRRRRWLPRRCTSQRVKNGKFPSKGSPTPSGWYRSHGETRESPIGGRPVDAEHDPRPTSGSRLSDRWARRR